MNNKKCDTYKEMIDKINDVAGIRVICPIKKDIFTLRNLIVKISGVNVIKEKDYVTHPKESGYSSYHLIVEVPIRLSNSNIYVKVEVQIRTLAMDFWANLEHKMKYKAKEKQQKAYYTCPHGFSFILHLVLRFYLLFSGSSPP